MSRTLASIQIIAEKKPIPEADQIEAVRINGWWVVSKKDEFQVGDYCVYFEVDSFLPVKPQYEFLRKSCFRSNAHMGDGFKLKTIKLRGQLSQGLALPLERVTHRNWLTPIEGEDLTEVLGVKLWEQPVSLGQQGRVKGNFPDFIPKTDQERVQNIPKQIAKIFETDETFEVTLKLDGSSMTVYVIDGKVGVCSRNLELDMTDTSNAMVAWVLSSGLHNALLEYEHYEVALQGEFMGPGIQGNREGFSSPQFYVYDMYDIGFQKYLSPYERSKVFNSLKRDCESLRHVRVYFEAYELIHPSIETLLELASGPSINHPIREGLVFKSNDRDFSFKVISNEYLLKDKT